MLRCKYESLILLEGIVLPHKSLKAIYVARLLMLGAIWTLSLCLSITVYKLHFTPEWWKSKSLLTVLGGIEVFSGKKYSICQEI